MKTWYGNHINLFCEQFWSRNCNFREATKIKCCLFLQESPAVAREDALQPI